MTTRVLYTLAAPTKAASTASAFSSFKWSGLLNTLGMKFGSEFTCKSKTSAIRAASFQFAILALLIVQNASDPLLMQKANEVSGVDRDGALVAWNSQTGVMSNQLVKLVLCFVLALYSGERPAEIVGSGREALSSSIPSLLFLLQGNIQFAAIEYLDAATYTALAQLKILAAAVFAVVLLRRPLPRLRWVALLGLVLGLILVQRSSAEVTSTSKKTSADGNSLSTNAVSFGIALSVITSFLSGFSGVYCEIILKDSKLSLWARNVHFSAIGCVLSLIGFVATGSFRSLILEGRFFDGYTPWCWACILNRSLGGLLVSMVTKYVDNLAKNICCAIAMVLTCTASVLMGRSVDWNFALGIAIVCASTTLYNIPSSSALLSFAHKMFRGVMITKDGIA
eukprot:TRINITY_DN22150_c0_g1_i1.p1 TRINITY_DN22150_c0_g1~~TRINITY_DN22150_c0_g1_i1.p1  ORF type:complete len:420 (-),score=56.67 TRINITY_DN22150_c0_g1_i1:30-1214(-)